MLRRDLVSVLRELSLELTGRRPGHAEMKAWQDPVTDLDLLADRLLTAQLDQLTPGVPVLSEERSYSDPGPEYWLIDPIDGTANLVAGLPHVAVSVALVRAGQTVVAAIADLDRGYVYSAARGLGAFCDEDQIRVPRLPPQLIGLTSGTLDALSDQPQLLAALRQYGKLRILGSQALQLCAVASGQLAATLSVEARRWDDIAGALILAEAGAAYSAHPANNSFGAPQQSLATHPALTAGLRPLAAQIWPETLTGETI